MELIYFNSLMIGISLITVSLAIIAFLIGFFYFGFTLYRRVSDLERGQEAFQSRITEFIQDLMKGAPPLHNPRLEIASRRDYLLAKLRANEISRTEAVELNDILIKEKEASQQRGDIATLIAVILGLALLSSILAKSKKSK